MNKGKNPSVFIKHSLQKDLINEAEFEQYTSNAAKQITFIIRRRMGRLEYNENPPKVVKALAHYISAQIHSKLNSSRVIKSWKRFKKHTDLDTKQLIKRIKNDYILVNRDIVTERKRTLNVELLDQQRLARGGVDPNSKWAKTWRENRVNEALRYEFGFDTEILYKHPVTVWRNTDSIIEEIRNRCEPIPYRRSIKHKTSKVKVDDPVGDIIRKQIKAVVKRGQSKQKPDPIFKTIDPVLKQDFKGDTTKYFMLPNDNIVESYFKRFGNDVEKAGKRLLYLYNGNPTEPIRNLFYLYSGGQNLEDFKK